MNAGKSTEEKEQEPNLDDTDVSPGGIDEHPLVYFAPPSFDDYSLFPVFPRLCARMAAVVPAAARSHAI